MFSGRCLVAVKNGTRWVLIFSLLALVGVGLGVAATASLAPLNVKTLKQQTDEITPTISLRDDWNNLGNNTQVNGTSLRILTTVGGTYVTTGAPIWNATNGFRKRNAAFGLVCNGITAQCGSGTGNNGKFALTPWISRGSYIQAKLGTVGNSGIPGLCLLCTNSTTASEGIVVRFRRYDPGPGAARWFMELGTVAASGAFTISPQTPAVDLGSPTNNQMKNAPNPLKLSYDGTTATATFTVNSVLYTATYTVANTYKTNTYAGVYSGNSTNTISWEDNTLELSYQ